MIIDIHTHIFPPEFIRNRAKLARIDSQFADIYRDKTALMATERDLLDSMEIAGVDVSVAVGFWWEDESIAEDHAQYLAEVSQASKDGDIYRILSLAPLPAEYLPEGVRGSGEVRNNDRLELSSWEQSSDILLAHVSEELGHDYPGKNGGLSHRQIYDLLGNAEKSRIIAAHWGGGLPFFAFMPEIARFLEEDRLIFDSAASKFLYSAEIFNLVPLIVGDDHVAWGSDFPLRPQDMELTEIKSIIRDDLLYEKFIGANAARFLRLDY